LKQSDDLLFARAVVLQRANKTPEAIDALNTFLDTFPKSRMTPGVKIRLALALADNHQASNAVAVLRDLSATASPQQQRPVSSEEENADEDDSGSDDEATSDDEDNSASNGEVENNNESESGRTRKKLTTTIRTRMMARPAMRTVSSLKAVLPDLGPVDQYPLTSRYTSDSTAILPANHWNAATVRFTATCRALMKNKFTNSLMRC
jgi:predicted Zn-dependent protease